MPNQPGRRQRAVSPWGFVGFAGLACVLFLDLATAVLAPWWVTALFLVLWGALFVRAVSWFVPHPTRVPWLALVGLLVWAPVISVGVRAWGWGD